MPKLGRYWLSIGVVALAAVLRLWGLASLPPGLHYDEAFHLLSAQAMLAGRGVPIYITGNQGNEPMQAYLATLTLTMLGSVPWAGRLISAWAGIVSIALVIRTGREMFGARVGVIAGLALTTLYWHLTISRWGTQPMLSTVAAVGTMAGLWHGVRSGRRQSYVWAGVSLALGLWAYVAFRLFPFAPLLAGVGLLIAARPQHRRAGLLNGLLAVCVAALLYAPLAWFFAQHPEWFFNRYSQITQSTTQAASPLTALTHNAVAVLGGLFVNGDLNWRQNLSGRPAFDVAQAAFFSVGTVVSFWRWRRPEGPALVIWALIGLAPAILTEAPPQFGRSVMATPALALLIALGFDWAWQHTGPWVVLRFGLGLALAFSLWVTAYTYFVTWGRDPNLFIAFDVGLRWIGEHLREAPLDAGLMETPVRHDYPTLEFSLGPEAYGRFKSFNGRECTILPSKTVSAIVYAVITYEDSLTLPILESSFPAGQVINRVEQKGAPYAALYQIPAGQVLQLSTETTDTARFADSVTMRGHTLSTPEVRPGDTVRLTVVWEVAQATSAAYKTFVHLYGPPQTNGDIVYAQRDAEPCDNSYPSWQWSPGDVIIEYYKIPVPMDVPSGDYTLGVGWYDAVTQVRLPVADDTGQPRGDVIEFEHVQVANPNP